MAPEQERFYECLECNEAITNPLCPLCLTKQIDVWLSSYPSEIRKKLIGNVKDYVEKANNIAGKSSGCIACNKPTGSLCPYCFTNHVFDELKRLKVSRVILKEFLQFFNYDFEHIGYTTAEAEKFGVI